MASTYQAHITSLTYKSPTSYHSAFTKLSAHCPYATLPIAGAGAPRFVFVCKVGMRPLALVL
jgi:hypothetical protein